MLHNVDRAQVSKRFKHSSLAHTLPEVEVNETIPCEVEGCTNLRYGFSRYCSRHLDRVRRNGHHTLAPVRWSRLESERKEVRAFLASPANAAHPMLLTVGRELRDWLTAPMGEHQDLVWRLAAAGVQPADIVVVITARLLHAKRHGSLAVGDARHKETAIGRLLVKLFGRQHPDEHFAPGAVRALARDALDRAGQLCEALADAIEAERQMYAKAKAEAASTPFVSTLTGKPIKAG